MIYKMTGSKNIFYAEDDLLTAKVMMFGMKKEGYSVKHYPTGEAVVEDAILEIPDLLLLDMMMPVKDGFEVYKAFKNNDKLKNIPIIIFSALDPTKEHESFEDIGKIFFLVKPCTPENVIKKIKEVIG